MNRSYELGFIIPTSVPETETQGIISMVQEWIKGFGGTVTKVDYWGRRRLAYPIQDFREGYYVFVQMEYPTAKLNELEYNMRFSDKVLRHLVVRKED